MEPVRRAKAKCKKRDCSWRAKGVDAALKARKHEQDNPGHDCKVIAADGTLVSPRLWRRRSE